MGEIQNQPFQLSFNSSLKVDFQGSRVIPDGGLILVRELDERLGFGDLIARQLTDSRRGKDTQLPLTGRLFAGMLGQIAGLSLPAGSPRLWGIGKSIQRYQERRSV
jgi:hypothetical protein